MFAKILGWLLSLVLAFFIGASVSRREPSDSELQQKVQDHMDIIIDESAARVDDVIDEVRENEHVKKAEEFADNVGEIVDNTVEDIHAHFDEPESDTDTTEEEAGEADETAENTVEAVEDAAEAAEEAVEEATEADAV